MQEAHAAAQKDESLAALKARIEAAKRRVGVETPTLLDHYDGLGPEVAAVVDAFEAINAEVEAMNAEPQEAGLLAIEDANTVYRRAPDVMPPESRSITTERDGKRLPSGGHGSILADAYKVEVETVTPRSVRRGAYEPSLKLNVHLLVARAGGKRHWPKGGK